jgi:site-specific recombinase XerD
MHAENDQRPFLCWGGRQGELRVHEYGRARVSGRGKGMKHVYGHNAQQVKPEVRERITTHGLRHSSAMELLQAGMD